MRIWSLVLLAFLAFGCDGGGDDNGGSPQDDSGENDGDGGADGATDDGTPKYAQTGALSLGSGVNGGAGSDIVPAGLTNDAVGDVGVGADNGDGTISLSIPTVAGKLSLGSDSSFSLAPPASLYSTTIPNQCSGSKTNDAWEFACKRLQYVLVNGESTQPNLFEDMLNLDTRMAFFTSGLSGGKKPYCMLLDEASLTNHKSTFTTAAADVIATMPDLFFNCYNSAEGGGETYDIVFGKKGDAWYLMEHIDDRDMRAAINNTVTGDFRLYTAAYDEDYTRQDDQTRGGISHFLLQGSTGYAEYSEDNGSSIRCPKRVIWGTYSDNNTYIYMQHWRNENEGAGSADDTCSDVATDPVDEICVNATALGTELSVSSAACTALKNGLSLPKEKYRASTSVYSELTSQNTDDKFGYMADWRFDDAIMAIKHALFYSTPSQYETWLEYGRRSVDEIAGRTTAPCLRDTPVTTAITLPKDFGFKLHLQCAETTDNGSFTAAGIKDNAIYQWYQPGSDPDSDSEADDAAANDRTMFLSKISKDATELWRMQTSTETSRSNEKGAEIMHMVADTATGVTEFVIAGENVSADFGCGVQFKANSSYIYARGRFAGYRAWGSAADRDCANVPLQTLCVDGTTIERTAMTNCTAAGLDFLSLKPLVPLNTPKDQSNAVDVDPNLIWNIAKPTIPEWGNRGDWGAYNNSDATPSLADPQYNIDLSKSAGNDVIHTMANCRVTDEMIDAEEEERLVDSNTVITYELALADLQTAALDGLTVASGYEVVRVAFSGETYGEEAVEPAASTASGTAELFLVKGTTETSLGTATLDPATESYEFGKLIKDQNTIAGLKELSFKLVVTLSASSSCSEDAPESSEDLEDDWGRSTLTYAVTGARLLF